MTLMLIPQFSIRWLLGVTAVCAVFFSIVGLGVRGHAWAAAVSIGIGSLVILAVVYALLFALVWAFSVTLSSLGRGRAGAGQSPFRPRIGPASQPEIARETAASTVLPGDPSATPEEP